MILERRVKVQHQLNNPLTRQGTFQLLMCHLKGISKLLLAKLIKTITAVFNLTYKKKLKVQKQTQNHLYKLSSNKVQVRKQSNCKQNLM
jgi:hypothetical protein